MDEYGIAKFPTPAPPGETLQWRAGELQDATQEELADLNEVGVCVGVERHRQRAGQEAVRGPRPEPGWHSRGWAANPSPSHLLPSPPARS